MWSSQKAKCTDQVVLTLVPSGTDPCAWKIANFLQLYVLPSSQNIHSTQLFRYNLELPDFDHRYHTFWNKLKIHFTSLHSWSEAVVNIKVSVQKPSTNHTEKYNGRVRRHGEACKILDGDKGLDFRVKRSDGNIEESVIKGKRHLFWLQSIVGGVSRSTRLEQPSAG